MDLTRDDLIETCAACNGTGWIEDPPNNPNQGMGFDESVCRGGHRATLAISRVKC